MCKKCVRRGSGGRDCAIKMKKVWDHRPHTFFSLLLRNLGPQTPSGHNFCAILILFVFRIVPGDGQLQPWSVRVKLSTPRYPGISGFTRRSAYPGIPGYAPVYTDGYNLCYAIVLPGRKSVFRAGFRPESSRESFKIGPPGPLRPAGGPILTLSRLESGRNPARKTDFRPGSTIALHRAPPPAPGRPGGPKFGRKP